MLHTDIPTKEDIQRLAVARGAMSVSIYFPTPVAPTGSEGPPIELRNLLTQAVEQLRRAGEDELKIERIQEAVFDLIDDNGFWRYLSNSLAIFVTPDSIRTFRLPNELIATVDVSDRFLINPLLRAVTFPQSAFILALAKGSVKLIEINAGSEPVTVKVPDLPTDAASAVGLESINGRSPSGRLKGSEGQKVRIRQYARAVDQALRPVLTGRNLPLILAAAEPLDSIYRSVNSYAHLADAGISGNAEESSDTELAAAARGILDDVYAAQLSALKEQWANRSAHGRGLTDLSGIAHAVTYGAVDTLFVNIDQTVHGYIDDKGRITLDEEGDASNYGVIDEIVRRALLTDASIYAVRAEDIPDGGSVAATLRFAV